MISAGNDIVALQAIDVQRTQNPAFYSKFISPAVFALFKPDEMTLVNFVWLVWSAQESAYKYLKRNDAELVFSPGKMQVQNLVVQAKTGGEHYYQGELLACGKVLPFLSLISQQYIVTVINQGNINWAVKQIEAADYETQSAAVRSILLNDLNMLGAYVQKHPSGYPVLLRDGEVLDIAVSFAHHDRYVSYCYQIPK